MQKTEIFRVANVQTCLIFYAELLMAVCNNYITSTLSKPEYVVLVVDFIELEYLRLGP